VFGIVEEKGKERIGKKRKEKKRGKK